MSDFRGGVIPAEIADFIVDRIGSVAELEGLLILRRDPQTKWSAQALAARLYVPASNAEEMLRLLCKNGFAAAVGSQPPLYSYRPESSELESNVDRLAALYSAHLVAVTGLIHSKARQRVQGFADAFRFRKDD